MLLQEGERVFLQWQTAVELSQRVKEVAALQALYGCRKPQEVSERLLQAAVSLAGTEHCAVFLFEEERTDPTGATRTGSRAMEGIPVRRLAGRAFRSGEIVSQEADPDGAGEGGSLIAVPIRGQTGRTFGAAVVDRAKVADLNDAMLQRGLLVVARFAGLLMENLHIRAENDAIFLRTVGTLVRAVEMKDPYFRGHSERVAFYARAIAESLGLDPEEAKEVEQAGLLHDVGSIGIPDAILHKEGPLDETEERLIRTHPEQGYAILRILGEERPLAAMVRHHHERVDGGGYPLGLSGEAIPLGARILAVAEAFDAATSARSYRGARTIQEGLREIIQGAGTAYDPAVVRAFTACMKDPEFQKEVQRRIEQARSSRPLAAVEKAAGGNRR